jgi:hypothetical protein
MAPKTAEEIERQLQKKYTKVFDRLYRRILRQSPRNGSWELVNVSRHNVRPAWTAFQSGSSEILAVRPITLNGKPYWVAAGTEVDGEKVGAALFGLGLLGAALVARPKPYLAIWLTDPHDGYATDVKDWLRQCRYVKSYREVRALTP